jgi:hypothetical protein
VCCKSSAIATRGARARGRWVRRRPAAARCARAAVYHRLTPEEGPEQRPPRHHPGTRPCSPAPGPPHHHTPWVAHAAPRKRLTRQPGLGSGLASPWAFRLRGKVSCASLRIFPHLEEWPGGGGSGGSSPLTRLSSLRADSSTICVPPRARLSIRLAVLIAHASGSGRRPARCLAGSGSRV